jgi:beta-lactamase class A
MRYPRFLACLTLALLAVLAAACVAAAPPAAVGTPTGAATQAPSRTTPPAGSTATAEGRLPSQGLAPTAEVGRPAGIKVDPELQKLVEAALAGKAEHYGVYVKDLTTGKGAAVNAGQVFNAASLFKVEVMFEVFRQKELGLVAFDELLEITPYYASFDLGTLRLEVGQSESVSEALYYMMSVSDNVAAVLLQDRAGSSNINSTMKALGLKDSGLFEDGLPATAQDFGVLLEAIMNDGGISDESRTQMLDLMESETIDNGVVAGLPKGTKVAHKTGNWTDATNDAAIVFGPKGAYILVVLSDTDHDSSGTKAISEEVYRYLAGAR